MIGIVSLVGIDSSDDAGNEFNNQQECSSSASTKSHAGADDFSRTSGGTLSDEGGSISHPFEKFVPDVVGRL